MADEETDSPYGLNKSDADFLKSFHLVLKELRGLVISNVEFYQRGNSSIYARYYAASCILFEHLQTLEPYVIDIVPRLQEYDFSPQVPGNGYRSFITIVNRCILCVMQLCRHISVNKNNLLFRSSYYLKELEAYVETVGQLIACLGYLKQLISLSKDGDLFYDEENPAADEILMEVEMLNTDCFYGRCLGFQFCESIQKLLQGIMVAMATFSECYEEPSQVIVLASSLLNSSKYIVDQELRARQVVNVTRTADIKFCKAFWSIPESPLLHHLRAFTYPQVEVSELISLEPLNFELPHTENTDETVTITPPCAHTGPAAVSVRLISHAVREGMVKRKKPVGKKGTASATIEPKSRGLLFHCHGGGFVAQSSQSHENYLRVWARKLKMPILSVDYSLAPEQPFPRALEESFYAYSWALKNPELLGWTGEIVCFAGDSAGGNLVISTALRAVSYRIRIPDGIMVAYSSTLVQYTPSPARLMAMIDPLLPVGILTRCLAAYAGIADKLSSALAKPIFCNPGKYESWEVVDSDDVMKDSVGAEITKKLQTESKTDNDSEGVIPDRKLLGVPSSGWYLSKEIRGSCQSIEDLDNEFVVCETEDLLEDSVHYKGKVTVIDEEFGRSAVESETRHTDECSGTSDDNVVDDTEMKPETSEKTSGAAMDMAIIDDAKSIELHETDTVSSQQGSHSVHDQVTSLSVHPGISSQKNIEQIRSVENQNHSVIFGIGNDIKHERDTTQEETLEEALKQLDSNVTITVDDVTLGSQTDKDSSNTKDGYAVCKDIIHEQDRRFMTIGGRTDMDRLSCHSVEDLNEISGNEESRSDDTTNNLDEKMDVGENCLDKKDETRNGLMTIRAQSNPDIEVNKDTVSIIESQEEDSFINELSRKKYEPPATNRFQRRSMSLNFPLSYQDGNSPSILPSPVFRTPLSPQLPPGSRSFTPKRFSVQRKIAQSPIKLFRELPIVKNFYMSPILAPDELLQGLPDIYMIACHFDPLLDDSIMFAKKLSKLGKNVDLSIVDHLPHGFLSLSDTSVEAKKAAGLCLEKIMKVLNNGAT